MRFLIDLADCINLCADQPELELYITRLLHRFYDELIESTFIPDDRDPISDWEYALQEANRTLPEANSRDADNSCNSTHRQLRDPVRTHIILLFECPSSCSSTSESASNEPEPVLSVLWNLQTAQYLEHLPLLGGTYFEYHPRSRSAILGYIVVNETFRSRRVGSLLMQTTQQIVWDRYPLCKHLYAETEGMNPVRDVGVSTPRRQVFFEHQGFRMVCPRLPIKYCTPVLSGRENPSFLYVLIVCSRPQPDGSIQTPTAGEVYRMLLDYWYFCGVSSEELGNDTFDENMELTSRGLALKDARLFRGICTSIWPSEMFRDTEFVDSLDRCTIRYLSCSFSDEDVDSDIELLRSASCHTGSSVDDDSMEVFHSDSYLLKTLSTPMPSSSTPWWHSPDFSSLEEWACLVPRKLSIDNEAEHCREILMPCFPSPQEDFFAESNDAS